MFRTLSSGKVFVLHKQQKHHLPNLILYLSLLGWDIIHTFLKAWDCPNLVYIDKETGLLACIIDSERLIEDMKAFMELNHINQDDQIISSAAEV